MSVSVKSPWVKISLGICVGALFGAVAMWQLAGMTSNVAAVSKEPVPLYWVAPMDPNYRRDQPGKSPMGMDLIPVFDNAKSAAVGVVQIDPAVLNNLGVRTARVRFGSLATQIETVGYVQFDETQITHIHPRVDGWIEQLMVKSTGDPIVAGEPLYAMYSPTLVNAQEELLLATERKNQVLISAALDRLASLQVPEEAIVRLQKTQQVTRTVTVSAPQTGVLNDLLIREGMFVKPGIELMSIAGLDHVWVIGEVFESQGSMVQQGDAVSIRLDYLPGRIWQGHIDYIYPVLNLEARTLSVRVRLSNADLALRPGMFAEMRIATQEAPATLVVPSEAVIRTGHQERVVLALDAGRFKSVAVKIGAVSDGQIEILSGLNEGDLIVTSAQFLIDSESSKTSDFSRFETPSSDAMAVGNTHQDPDMPMTNANQARGMPASEAHQDHAMPMTDAHQGHDIPMTDAHQGHDMPVSAPIDDMHQSHEMNMPASVDDPHDGHSQSAMTMKNSVSPETMQ